MPASVDERGRDRPVRRGEIWWVDAGPASGGEVRGKRPAVIVSNDAANKHLNRVQIVPMTSNVERLYPSEAFVTLRGKKSKAMADQVMTVAKKRLINKAGSVKPGEMRQVERALRVQLGLE